MKNKVIIIGTGGHARVVKIILKTLKKYHIVGFLDRDEGKIGEYIDEIPIIGTFEDIKKFCINSCDCFLLALGDNNEREIWYNKVIKLMGKIPTIKHPSTFIEDDAILGNGVQVCIGSIICTKTVIGDNVIINSGVIVDHECIIGNNCHIAPGVNIAGRVKIGNNSFIGIGTTVKDKIKIGKNCIIGVGSIVLNNIPDDSIAYGIPAEVKRKI